LGRNKNVGSSSTAKPMTNQRERLRFAELATLYFCGLNQIHRTFIDELWEIRIRSEFCSRASELGRNLRFAKLVKKPSVL